MHSIPTPGRDARADESARLESVCGATHRGFESHSLRWASLSAEARDTDADMRPEQVRAFLNETPTTIIGARDVVT